MDASQNASGETPGLAALERFAQRAAATLQQDDRVRAFWLTGSLAPTLESIVQGRAAYARLFLPRARRLMEANSMVYPQAFEDATHRHLKQSLGLYLS